MLQTLRKSGRCCCPPPEAAHLQKERRAVYILVMGSYKPLHISEEINYIPFLFTFNQCHVTAILQSDWPRTIFNVGTRKCDPFDQTLSRFFS